MRLKKAQKEALLVWIAEGLESDEINKRAKKFKPPFSVLRSQVTWYRKTRDTKLEAIQEAGEVDSLKTGFAVKENRVKALQTLAEKMLEQLTREEDNRLWTTMVKGIGSNENYQRVEYEEFNKAEVDSFRGVLDDIATEVGQRIRRTDVTSKDKPLVPERAILKELDDNELDALEKAARILESAGSDSAPSIPG
jgi:phosphopantetheinyl transferase (holo-ACP synthase)